MPGVVRWLLHCWKFTGKRRSNSAESSLTSLCYCQSRRCYQGGILSVSVKVIAGVRGFFGSGAGWEQVALEFIHGNNGRLNTRFPKESPVPAPVSCWAEELERGDGPMVRAGVFTDSDLKPSKPTPPSPPPPPNLFEILWICTNLPVIWSS